MELNLLRAADFRNIELAELRPDKGLTVICGDNGQGKTALLEGIYLLCGGKSFRGARDADMVRHGRAAAALSGEATAGGRLLRIEIAVEGAGSARRGRYAAVNGVERGRAASIAGVFTAVVFEPGHLSLVKGGPEGRRRFVDGALCQLYPGYVGILRRYARALAQKNALLKRYAAARDAAATLDAFDGELAAAGSEISRRRGEYLAAAGRLAAGFYAELSGGAERLELRFSPCGGGRGLREALAACRAADIRAGFCTEGAHREDFDIGLSGENARVYGSQGQQRSAALCLKLAEGEAAREVTGEHPVLLLDDVLSELDEGRQSYLLARMGGCQSVVTCCDAGVFGRAAGSVLRVSGGRIV